MFQGGAWKCYHLDDINDEVESLPGWELLKIKTVAELFEHSLDERADIHETVDEATEQDFHDQPLESRLSVDYLIRTCLLKAVASLVDSECALEAGKSRKTHRLSLLSQLLEKTADGNSGKRMILNVDNIICNLL